MTSKNALIIAYSRPTGVSALLNSLNDNAVRNVFVSIDGPRNDRDRTNQQAILEIISDFSSKSDSNIKVRQNETNLGVAGGVLSAIDWFFSFVQEGLVLEDDLEVGDDFYRFAFEGLDRFENNPDVWMISGTQLFPEISRQGYESWTNYPMIWGWAGWGKKWLHMRDSLLRPKKTTFSKITNAREIFWTTGANRALSGKIDTWDIPLAYEFWHQGKFCIIPPVNLISNVGDDISSTHTSNNNLALRQTIQDLPDNFQFSKAVEADSIEHYNLKLESKVFNIKKRHIFLPYYALLFDRFRFPQKDRKKPLRDRSDWRL